MGWPNTYYIDDSELSVYLFDRLRILHLRMADITEATVVRWDEFGKLMFAFRVGPRFAKQRLLLKRSRGVPRHFAIALPDPDGYARAFRELKSRRKSLP